MIKNISDLNLSYNLLKFDLMYATRPSNMNTTDCSVHVHCKCIYIYKVVISVCLFVCLFVCPIKTQEPQYRFAPNFDWRTRENYGNDLSLVRVGLILSGKIGKIIIYDKARVNGGTNYDYPGQRWVPKLVYNKGTEFLLHFYPFGDS